MRPICPPALLAAALALAGCSKTAPPPLSVTDARIVLPALPDRPGAAYFTLHGGPQPAQLIAIESAKIGSIELHESMAGMMGSMPMTSMLKLDSVDVPAAGTVSFAPGGRHAMLFGIDPAVKPGDSVALSFRLARGAPIAVVAKAQAPGS